VSVEAHIELLVATLDLKLVQLIRDAMRVADLAGARQRDKLAPAATFEPRRHIHPEPYFEPRRHYHPTPVFEPREHISLRPRVEPCPPILLPCEPVSPRRHEPVFRPPWKVMPWENPPQPALKVKVVKLKPDIVRKGSLIDCFL
jgi:hypothetical protein